MSVVDRLMALADAYARASYCEGEYLVEHAKEETRNAQTALRTALEQAFDGEPVATVINNNLRHWWVMVETKPNVTLEVGTKLYAAPQPAADAQAWRGVEQ